MCLISPDGKHSGICVNAVWFDLHNGDTVFLCVHPDNDVTKPASMTRTLSLGAWQEIVTHIASGGGFVKDSG